MTYHGETFNQAIEEALRQNPGFRGNVIAIPEGRLERLLRANKGLRNNEDTQWQARN